MPKRTYVCPRRRRHRCACAARKCRCTLLRPVFRRYNSFSMAKLGFLGLGLMGYPMARNLLRAGHEVALWSNTPPRPANWPPTEKGQFCETPEAGRAKTPTSSSSASATPRWRSEVILGANGIIEGVTPGRWWRTASTISPSDSRQIGAGLARPRASIFWTLPCTGSTPGAEGGTLTL